MTLKTYKSEIRTRAAWDIVPLVPLPARGHQAFSYLPPAASGSEHRALSSGMLVRVPFGPRTVQGIVWKETHEPRRARRLKPISAMLSKGPLFTLQELAAFQQLADISLESFASLLTAATRVRVPLKHAEQNVSHTVRGRGFTLRVRWGVPIDVLPKTPRGQVLILTPEIVFAQVIVKELERRHHPVAFFAQGLGVRQRRAIIQRLVGKEHLVIVSTHAGIFLPLPTLSQIVMIEAALASHRQWDLHPRYDSRVGALFLARHRSVPITLQSSLPSLDLSRLSSLKSRRRSLPALQLLSRRSADPLLSHELRSLLQRAVEHGERVLLFHDIVGAERLFVCDSCRVSLRCQQCGGILERAGSQLRCQSCGAAHGPLPHFCPRCRSPHLTARSVGTAQLEQDLRAAIRDATIVRADRETLPRKKTGETNSLPRGNVILASERGFAVLQPQSVDRIVVLDADRILEDGQFDAADRWVALIARLASFQKTGTSAPLVIQTTHPHLGVVRLLSEDRLADWEAAELADREQLGYPPFTALLTLERAFETRERARAATQSVAETFQASSAPLRIGYRVLGTARTLRGEILLRGPLASLQHALARLPPGWKTDAHVPLSLLIT